NLTQALLNQIGDKEVRSRQERVFLELHRQLRQNSRERSVEALLPMLTAPRGSRTTRRDRASALGT
ncbi:MAG TPA: hypothetical protein VIA64_17330, partial [Burkholderiales bacterium]